MFRQSKKDRQIDELMNDFYKLVHIKTCPFCNEEPLLIINNPHIICNEDKSTHCLHPGSGSSSSLYNILTIWNNRKLKRSLEYLSTLNQREKERKKKIDGIREKFIKLIEIKPCPFCQREPWFIANENRIACSNGACLVSPTTGYYGRWSVLLNDWNMRIGDK